MSLPLGDLSLHLCSVHLYYAISPLATSPDTYTTSTSFSFVKYDSSDTPTTVNLPTTDKNSAAITPSEPLKDLCGYQSMSSNSMMNFHLWLDGRTDGSVPGIHTETLNTWIKNIGITTDSDLHRATNPFNDIVQLYFHVKAIDDAGNTREVAHPIRIDPLGTRPVVSIGYPSAERAGENTDAALRLLLQGCHRTRVRPA